MRPDVRHANGRQEPQAADASAAASDTAAGATAAATTPAAAAAQHVEDQELRDVWSATAAGYQQETGRDEGTYRTIVCSNIS